MIKVKMKWQERLSLPPHNFRQGDQVRLSKSALNTMEILSEGPTGWVERAAMMVGVIHNDLTYCHTEYINVRWGNNAAPGKDDSFMPDDLVLVARQKCEVGDD